MTYQDEEKKIEYHKKRLTDLYLQQSRLISETALQKKIDDIDTKLSIFKQAYVQNGEHFNLEKFNEQKYEIYHDLAILYEVVYSLAKKAFNSAENKVRCAINEFYEIAKRYKNKTVLESLSIYGKTLYYETNGFKQTYKDSQLIIDLGSLTVPDGSYLACLLKSRECESKDVLFKFDDAHQVSEFSYNKDYLKFLDNCKYVTYNFTTEENTNNAFKINIGQAIKESSAYSLYAGENKIKIKYLNDGSEELFDVKDGSAFVASRACEISFYAYDASVISFDSKGECSYKSFEGYSIDTPKRSQKVLLRVEQNFVLNVVTDGRIFSDKGSCVIKEDELYSQQGYKNIGDYMIEEIKFGADLNFENVQVIISGAQSSFYDIDYIAIKQARLANLE